MLKMLVEALQNLTFRSIWILRKLDDHLYCTQLQEGFCLLCADLIQYWNIFNGNSHIKPELFFSWPLHGCTRGHHYKIHVPHVTLNVCCRSFSIWCIHVWNSLPESDVTAPGLTSFKRALSDAISDTNCICLQNRLLMMCNFLSIIIVKHVFFLWARALHVDAQTPFAM